jgi:hypothetical protein
VRSTSPSMLLQPPTEPARHAGGGWWALMLLPFFLGGMILWVLGAVAEGVPGARFALAFAGTLSVVTSGAALWRLYRTRHARGALATVEARLDPERPRRGATLEVEVTIAPLVDGQLNGISVRLNGQREGEKRPFHRGWHLFDHTMARALRPGEPVRLTHRFDVPAEAPASREGAVRWWLEVDVDVDGWSPWVCRHPVEVRA